MNEGDEGTKMVQGKKEKKAPKRCTGCRGGRHQNGAVNEGEEGTRMVQ